MTTQSSATAPLPLARVALPWVTTVARLVLAGVLIVAGWSKMGAPALSIQAVKAYELLPEAVAEIVGYVLPILEIVIGLLLVIGLLTRMAAIATAVLMLAFVIGIASAWARGLNIDCGCFGGGGALPPGQKANYLPEILRDVGFLALAAWVAVKPPGRFALDTALGLAPAADGDQSPYRDDSDADDDPEADEERNREKDD
ncbi:putative membrane protein YphA (DoxX/SURF4 family) [Thermopolyspora flexuosa]|uniref:Putative membrane protein YphA (DoxX/SURF4 family) n=1 Tax=Thermopolyspora flexuosa TaxID=103836 RepID=A0A543IZH5_9ACTN|nr:putative membrane protein YphA (DoxX/SURF4 family) [Thermopolyspora flexuosa]